MGGRARPPNSLVAKVATRHTQATACFIARSDRRYRRSCDPHGIEEGADGPKRSELESDWRWVGGEDRGVWKPISEDAEYQRKTRSHHEARQGRKREHISRKPLVTDAEAHTQAVNADGGDLQPAEPTSSPRHLQQCGVDLFAPTLSIPARVNRQQSAVYALTIHHVHAPSTRSLRMASFDTAMRRLDSAARSAVPGSDKR